MKQKNNGISARSWFTVLYRYSGTVFARPVSIVVRKSVFSSIPRYRRRRQTANRQRLTQILADTGENSGGHSAEFPRWIVCHEKHRLLNISSSSDFARFQAAYSLSVCITNSVIEFCYDQTVDWTSRGEQFFSVASPCPERTVAKANINKRDL